ncbi:hypothetical protein SUGI_0736670 [Cryptomeria japonica]|nr:hypothetical protein SUGI_0736670 [Cryptomeria japonica]
MDVAKDMPTLENSMPLNIDSVIVLHLLVLPIAHLYSNPTSIYMGDVGVLEPSIFVAPSSWSFFLIRESEAIKAPEFATNSPWIASFSVLFWQLYMRYNYGRKGKYIARECKNKMGKKEVSSFVN